MVMRLTRFAAAGIGGFVVQMSTFTALAATGVHYLVATAIAIEIAILCNFWWHERWTWRDRPSIAVFERGRRLMRFNLLTGITSILGSLLVTGALVEVAGFSPIIGNVVSVAALGVLNFVGCNALVFRAGVTIAVLALAVPARAEEATLQAKTLKDFARYVTAVEARSRGLQEQTPFLAVERLPAPQRDRAMASLKRGEVLVTRDGLEESTEEVSIEGGSINHWRGTVFVPDVKLDEVLKVLQEPQSDKHKQEDVISSRVVSRDGNTQKVFLRLKRTKFVTVVYDTEYDVEYKRLAPERALSNSISTRIVEIENAGTPRERALPEGNDHGYMWRLNTYWRYKQLDGGVVVEVESLTLSRDLPPIIGPLIRPIVNSTARESMTRTLASVRARFAD